MTHVAYFKQKLFPFSDLQLKDGGFHPERWGPAMKNISGQLYQRSSDKKTDVKMKKHRRKKDKPIEENGRKHSREAKQKVET